MPIVAITRQLGSFGTAIAGEVARALQVPVVHREVAERVCAQWGVEIRLVLGFESFVQPRVPVVNSLATTLLSYVHHQVAELALRSPGAVFRGWGAAQFLHRVSNSVCVFVGAPEKVRVDRVRARLDCDRRTAHRLVRENDALRARLAREHAGCDWKCWDGYDLAINTGRTSVAEAVAEIVALTQSRQFGETPRTARPLRHLCREALARASLLHNPATRNVRLHVKATDDELFVAGIVDDGEQREAILDTLATALRGASIKSSLRSPTDFRCRASSI